MNLEPQIEEVASALLPSAYSSEGLAVRAFRNLSDGQEHLAILKGPQRNGALVRVHSQCLTGDTLGSLRCDCGAQLQAALRRIGKEPSGAVIYLTDHEGRGVGLANKIRAYALQDCGLDTVEANAALGFADDERHYRVAAQILKTLGITQIRLLSNNPRKTEGLRIAGIKVLEEVQLVLPATLHNAAYLAAKRDKLGHRLPGCVAMAGE